MTSYDRIIELGFRLNNADGPGAKVAAANIDAGKAAVWPKASFSHAASGILSDALNLVGDAKAAMAQCTAETGAHRDRDYAKHPEWLDLVIPLNAAGVHLLADAYAACGTFRSARELFERADKAGWAIEREAV